MKIIKLFLLSLLTILPSAYCSAPSELLALAQKKPMRVAVFQEHPVMPYPEGSVEKIHQELSQQLTLVQHFQTMPGLFEFYPHLEPYDDEIYRVRMQQIPNPPPANEESRIHDGRASVLQKKTASCFGHPPQYTPEQLNKILYEKAILEKKFQATQVKLWQAKYQELQRQHAKELAEIQPGAGLVVEGEKK